MVYVLGMLISLVLSLYGACLFVIYAIIIIVNVVRDRRSKHKETAGDCRTAHSGFFKHYYIDVIRYHFADIRRQVPAKEIGFHFLFGCIFLYILWTILPELDYLLTSLIWDSPFWQVSNVFHWISDFLSVVVPLCLFIPFVSMYICRFRFKDSSDAAAAGMHVKAAISDIIVLVLIVASITLVYQSGVEDNIKIQEGLVAASDEGEFMETTLLRTTKAGHKCSFVLLDYLYGSYIRLFKIDRTTDERVAYDIQHIGKGDAVGTTSVKHQKCQVLPISCPQGKTWDIDHMDAAVVTDEKIYLIGHTDRTSYVFWFDIDKGVCNYICSAKSAEFVDRGRKVKVTRKGGEQAYIDLGIKSKTHLFRWRY